MQILLFNRLEAALQKLKVSNPHIRAKKCSIGYEKIKYLGYKVSGLGIYKNMDTVEGIRNLEARKAQKTLRRFLGMAYYYRNFIFGFAKIWAPLNQLCRKRKSIYGK